MELWVRAGPPWELADFWLHGGKAFWLIELPIVLGTEQGWEIHKQSLVNTSPGAGEELCALGEGECRVCLEIMVRFSFWVTGWSVRRFSCLQYSRAFQVTREASEMLLPPQP